MPRPLRRIYLNSCLSDEYVASLKSKKYLDESDFDILVSSESGENRNYYKPDYSLLFAYRHDIVPPDDLALAVDPLRLAALNYAGLNRQTVAGGPKANFKLDGTLSNTRTAIKSNSAIIGNMDRTVREPYCRATAYTRDQVESWIHVQPFIASVGDLFARYCPPDRYRATMEVVARTDPYYIIPDTPFTTVTVNRNLRTVMHKDKHDLKEGFGVMSVVRAEGYRGCYLVFPKYRIAVDMRPGDLCLADVHEFHGNTAFIDPTENYERISTVFYHRENMFRCGTPEQELEHAKNRKRGEPLY